MLFLKLTLSLPLLASLALGIVVPPASPTQGVEISRQENDGSVAEPESPQITQAPEQACDSCYSVDLGFGLYDASPIIVTTLTQSIIEHVRMVNGQEVVSTEVSWSNKTAFQTAAIQPFGSQNPDILDQLADAHVEVEDGTFKIADYVFTVGSTYAVATALPEITVYAPSGSECVSQTITGGLEPVYTAGNAPEPTGVAADIDRVIHVSDPSLPSFQFNNCPNPAAQTNFGRLLMGRNPKGRGRKHNMKRSIGGMLRRAFKRRYD